MKSTALEVCSIFSFAEKDLAAVEDESNKGQQDALASNVVNHILGCIDKTVASRTRENINSLALMRLHPVLRPVLDKKELTSWNSPGQGPPSLFGSCRV